ncbi:MAG: hypothetical protein K2Z81_19930, partial [Cyanobacteria bacterium]|nr:hypothetical protein [Cyanobacteriota bacterium]
MNQKVIILLASLVVSTPQALAFPLKVDKIADNKDAIEARLSTTNLGTVKIPAGRAVLSGDRVLVRAVPDWMFDGHTVLSGRLLSSRSQTDTSGTTVTGVAYFIDGDWINSLDKFKSKD